MGFYDDDFYGSNVPYDPDMSVGEALDAGLIAVIDSGAIGRTYVEPCGYESPYPRGNAMHDAGSITCTRDKGHSGTHAFVVRWQESYRDFDQRKRLEELRAVAREQALRDQQEQMAAHQRRMMDSLRQASRDMQAPLNQMKKELADDLNKALHREDSRVYGAGNTRSKKDMYRDRGVGKVRGKR